MARRQRDEAPCRFCRGLSRHRGNDVDAVRGHDVVLGNAVDEPTIGGLHDYGVTGSQFLYLAVGAPKLCRCAAVAKFPT